MWISQSVAAMLAVGNEQLREAEKFSSVMQGENTRLCGENIRLRADLDWFKHRLNQVEQERGQLIQAALGMKISIPQFVTTHDDPGAALHEMPDLRSIGEDALDQGMQTEAEPAEGVDYALMPGYKAKR